MLCSPDKLTGAELQQMASTIMAATSRVVAAKTPFLGQGRAAANASPLRDVAAAASGRITMVRNVTCAGFVVHGTHTLVSISINQPDN